MAERGAKDDLIGQTIGGYVLRARIGEGGMGAVYLGVHRVLEKRVAVKVLLDGGATPEARERFLREARAVAAIHDPHIVVVHDFATLLDGRAYISMEHLEGESLASVRKRRGKLPPREAVAIVAQALEGLATAHARGVVHRDIKPANLFLARGEGDGPPVVKILDFGIAKLRDVAHGATRTGAILGTPEYMSPEQARGDARAADARADLYSVGIVLYALLAGRTPFASKNWGDVLAGHVLAPPPTLLAIRGVPPELDRAVMRALAKEPEGRHATALEMRDALIAAVGGALDPIAPPVVEAIEEPPPASAQATEGLGAPEETSAPTAAATPQGRAPRSGAEPSRSGSIAVTPAVTRRSRVVPIAAMVGLAVLVASTASIALALRARVVSRSAPPSAPPTTSPTPPTPTAEPWERCEFAVIDPQGTTHAFGGARKLSAEQRGDVLVSVYGSDRRLRVDCTMSIGRGYASFDLEIPPRAQAVGTYALRANESEADLTVSLPPAGLPGAKYMVTSGPRYGTAPFGTLEVTEYMPGIGQVLAGTFEGTLPPDEQEPGPPVTVRASFRFRQ